MENTQRDISNGEILVGNFLEFFWYVAHQIDSKIETSKRLNSLIFYPVKLPGIRSPFFILNKE